MRWLMASSGLMMIRARKREANDPRPTMASPSASIQARLLAISCWSRVVFMAITRKELSEVSPMEADTGAATTRRPERA